MPATLTINKRIKTLCDLEVGKDTGGLTKIALKNQTSSHIVSSLMYQLRSFVGPPTILQSCGLDDGQSESKIGSDIFEDVLHMGWFKLFHLFLCFDLSYLTLPYLPPPVEVLLLFIQNTVLSRYIKASEVVLAHIYDQ